MLAFAVLLLAALSRFFFFYYPGLHHFAGLNFTAVGAGLLFFGSRQPRRLAWLAFAVMAATDVILTKFVYHFPFHISGYLITWAWYAAVALLASSLLCRVTALRVISGVFASATSFFLLSNFVVWAGGGLYPHTLRGIADCYKLALPFYGNDLASTGVFCALFFGIPALAAKFALKPEPAAHTA